MTSRDLVFVAIMMAIGTALYAVTPNIANMTPDMVYVFTVLALLLVRPKLGPAVGIGLVAGVLGMAFSKSAVPWINIPAHLVGTTLAALVIRYTPDGKGEHVWKPVLASLVAGVSGGGIAITTFWQLAGIPTPVYLFAMWPAVLATAAIAAVINVALYTPARRAYLRGGPQMVTLEPARG